MTFVNKSEILMWTKENIHNVPDTDQTAEGAKERVEELAKYIKEQKKSKKLFNRIVVSTDRQWRYNNNEKYSYDPNNFKGWKYLD